MAQGCAILGMCGMEAVCGLCMNRYNMREYVHSINKETQLRSMKVNPTLPPMELHSGRFFFLPSSANEMKHIWGMVRNRQFPALASSSPGLSCLFLSALGATWKLLLHCHDTYATSQPPTTRAIKLECRQYAMSVAPAPLCQDLN